MNAKSIEALIECLNRAMIIPTGVGGQQVGAGLVILRARMTDAEVSDLRYLLADALRREMAKPEGER